LIRCIPPSCVLLDGLNVGGVKPVTAGGVTEAGVGVGAATTAGFVPFAETFVVVVAGAVVVAAGVPAI